MAVTCARCGAQNPDGNLYCQTCGTPLAMTAPATAPETAGSFQGPPPNLAPPVGGPSGYASPYYTPTGPQVPVHRTPWTLIVAAVIALTLLAAGFGTAFAVLNNRASSNAPSSLGDVPSPTPGLSPSPVASPTPVSTGPQSASNDGLSLSLPPGWVVDTKDNESIVITDPNSEGSVTVSSGSSDPVQTAQQNKDTVVSALKSKYPDVRDCPNSRASNVTLGGAGGISWTLCFTLTGQGSSVAAAASLFAGANRSGSVYYLVMVLTTQDNLQNYLALTKPIVQSITWKLS